MKKLRIGELEQNRTEIAEGRSFVYLVMFVKLVLGISFDREDKQCYYLLMVVIAMS